MLVYRQNGNLAYNAEPQIEETPQKPKKKTIGKTVVIPFKMKVKIISRVVMVSCLAFFMLARFAAVSKANLELIEMKNDVVKQQSAVTEVESNLSSKMELSTIQQKATSLGMSFPDNERIVYLEVVPYDQLVAQNKTEQNHASIVKEIID